MSRTFRVLPQDWGEGVDKAAGGRTVDLITPEAGTNVYTSTTASPRMRIRTKDWAWQHVTGDVDYYDISILPVSERPPRQPVCEFDTEGSLVIDAAGTRIQVPVMGANGDHSITLTNLNNTYPGSHVFVEIRQMAGQGRGVYRLTATWQDGHFYEPKTCELLRQIKGLQQRLAGYKLEKKFVLWKPGTGPDLPDPPPYKELLQLSSLGAVKAIELSSGDALHTILSGAADEPVVGRLYDLNGVLLAESSQLDEAAQSTAPTPDGLVPHGVIDVNGLTPGSYLLQISPLFDAGAAGKTQLQVGLVTAAP